jgi:hypothetical protein
MDAAGRALLERLVESWRAAGTLTVLWATPEPPPPPVCDRVLEMDRFT